MRRTGSLAPPRPRIDVVIHPQSVVHSMVELSDGSIIAQLGVTDMRLPIQYAFSYPDRWGLALPPLDVARLGALEFGAPDLVRFPCLRLAFDALKHGGAWPIVLNAANEVAVGAFLAGRLRFPDIPRVIEAALSDADRATSRAARARRGAPGGRLGPDIYGPNCQYATIVLVSIGGGALPKVPVVTLLAFLFVLGVLIFVHELGHFLMARAHGVRVLRFSLGFDPKILKFTRGGTEYSIGIIPLGGFVKLAGETVDDERTGAPDEFLSKSKWVRFQVYLAGPVMNLLLAFVVLAFVLMKGADVPLYQSAAAVVGAVEAGSPADRAGIKPGDRIVSIDGRDIPTWDALDMEVTPKANRALAVAIDRRRRTADARDHAGGVQQVRDRRSGRAARAAAAVRGDSAGKAGGTRRVPARRRRPRRSTGSAGSISRRSSTRSRRARARQSRSRSSATARRRTSRSCPTGAASSASRSARSK